MRQKFTARSASDRTDDWPLWMVVDSQGQNILGDISRMLGKPGAVFTNRCMAEKIAAILNKAK